MLRITPASSHAMPQRYVLEGRLRGPWVAELAAIIAAAGESPEGLELDLSGVHYVDAPGLALLCEIQDQGVVLRSVSPFVAELLHTRTL
jgi:ABC-type transporter Mla MlaB component